MGSIPDCIKNLIKEDVKNIPKEVVLQALNLATKGDTITWAPYTVTVRDKDTTTITLEFRWVTPLNGLGSDVEGSRSISMTVIVPLRPDDTSTWYNSWVDSWNGQEISGELEITYWRKKPEEKILYANLPFSRNLGKSSWDSQGTLTAFPIKTEVGNALPEGARFPIFLDELTGESAVISLGIPRSPNPNQLIEYISSPVPFFKSGLILLGTEGEFGYNRDLVDPTPEDYIGWAERHGKGKRWKSLQSCQPGSEIGYIGSTIIVDPLTLGLLFVVPIEIIWLKNSKVALAGGQVKFWGLTPTQAYAIADLNNGTFTFGIVLDKSILGFIDFPVLIEGFFDLNNPSAWYIHLGTPQAPLSMSVFGGLGSAALYLMVSGSDVALGAAITIGKMYKWWIVKVGAYIGIGIAALVGWKPFQVAADFVACGEAGFKIWKFGFMFSIYLRGTGHFPQPLHFSFELEFVLDLPWPIPNVTIPIRYEFGTTNPTAPQVTVPLLAKNPVPDAVYKLSAIHPLSRRQKELKEEDPIWPDDNIVVPFDSRCFSDGTDIQVLNPLLIARVHGGYVSDKDKVDDYNNLAPLKIVKLVNGSETDILNLKAVWDDGEAGSGTSLHILATNPYSVLTPSFDGSVPPSQRTGRYVEQNFGNDPTDPFKKRQFGEVLIKSAQDLSLNNCYYPELPTLVLTNTDSPITISFQYTDEDLFEVDQVELYMVEVHKSEPDARSDFSFSPDFDRKEVIITLSEGLELVRYSIPHTRDVTIVGSGINLFAVGYREQKNLKIGGSDHCILPPGKYRLDVGIKTKATSLYGFTEADASIPVLKTTFDVKYPDTIRPYIEFATVGDYRIFGDYNHGNWNPTPYGRGFPAYRNYLLKILFRVDYLNKIFGSLTLKITHDDGSEVSQLLDPASYDQESIMRGKIANTATLRKMHNAQVSISFKEPGSTQPTVLDKWQCCVSRFNGFAAHLNPGVHSKTRYIIHIRKVYGPKSPYKATLDCDILTTEVNDTNRINLNNSIIDRYQTLMKKIGGAPQPKDFKLLTMLDPETGKLKPEVTKTGKKLVIISECESAPESWKLPQTLVNQLVPLDYLSGLRFAKFAQESGVRLATDKNDKDNKLRTLLNQLDPPERTRLEAFADDKKRIIALWLRTPEPLDWSRVSGTITVNHLIFAIDKKTGKEEESCPKKIAPRPYLELNLRILPSPDACSAFLVGDFNNTPIYMPRGQYRVTLSFDPDLNVPQPLSRGQAKVRLETIEYVFIYYFGETWPTCRKLIQPIDLRDVYKKFTIIKETLVKNPRTGTDSVLRKKPDPRAQKVTKPSSKVIAGKKSEPTKKSQVKPSRPMRRKKTPPQKSKRRGS